MTSAPGGSFDAATQEASAGVDLVDAFGPADPQFAALKARSVAGEVVSPATGLVRTWGVLAGDERSCEGGSATGCVGAVSPGPAGERSPRIGRVESAELAKENSRGSLKTGGGDLT